MNISVQNNFNSVYFPKLNKPCLKNADKPSFGSLNSQYAPVGVENIKAYYSTDIFSYDELSKIQQETDKSFFMECPEKWNYKEEKNILYNNNLNEFADNIFNIMEKYSINTPNKILSAFEKTANTSEEEISKYSESFSIKSYKYTAKKKMQIKQEFLQEFLKSVERIKGVGTGNSPLSMEDLKLLLNSKVERINNRYNGDNLNKRVKEKLKYSPDEITPDEKIVLNEEEMQELKKLANTDKDLSYEELRQKAVSKYVSGDWALKYASERVQKAVLLSQPRYNSKNKEHFYDWLNFENHPVARWLFITENPDEFAEGFKVGDTYKYQYLQSCSKDCSYAENEYKDSTIDMNVKFVIHPKSETSQARDIGERKYGDNEVIYLPNQEFTILDKQLVKYHDQNNDFYRWVIHLQEK